MNEKFLVNVDNKHHFTIHWDEKLLKSEKAFNRKNIWRFWLVQQMENLSNSWARLILTVALDLIKRLQSKICWNYGTLKSAVLQCVLTLPYPTPEISWGMYSLGGSQWIPFVVDVMPSPYARNHNGGVFKALLGSTSSPKVDFFDILRSKWSEHDLTMIDFSE